MEQMVFYDEPIQTVLITCRGHSHILGNKTLKDNIITVDWHMPVSFKPSLYGISIGKNRFSLDLIKSSKCFIVNFIDYSLKDAALHCGTTAGVHADKFKDTGLKKEEGDKVDCPRIGEALAYLECEVINEVDAGDHILFIGKIIGGEHLKDGNRLFHTTGKEFIEVK